MRFLPLRFLPLRFLPLRFLGAAAWDGSSALVSAVSSASAVLAFALPESASANASHLTNKAAYGYPWLPLIPGKKIAPYFKRHELLVNGELGPLMGIIIPV